MQVHIIMVANNRDMFLIIVLKLFFRLVEGITQSMNLSFRSWMQLLNVVSTKSVTITLFIWHLLT